METKISIVQISSVSNEWGAVFAKGTFEHPEYEMLPLAAWALRLLTTVDTYGAIKATGNDVVGLVLADAELQNPAEIKHFVCLAHETQTAGEIQEAVKYYLAQFEEEVEEIQQPTPANIDITAEVEDGIAKASEDAAE